jgi:hypothetical protein
MARLSHPEMNASPESWLFSVSEAPVEVVIATGAAPRRTRVSGKKALVAADNGQVLGIVGRGYRIVTNEEALELCRELCRQLQPGSSSVEWVLANATGPKSRSRVALDLKHRTHVLNLWDNPGGISEIHTPFVRVINSYNGRRALRFDVGFMRKHCSNGVIFEEKVATVHAPHTQEGIAKLDLADAARNFGELKQQFVECVGAIRGIALSDVESMEIVRTILGLPVVKDTASPAANEGAEELHHYVAALDARHRVELGENAYATFNTLTDFATRPPRSSVYRRETPTLQGVAGSWLKKLHDESQSAGFSIKQHVADLRVAITTA